MGESKKEEEEREGERVRLLKSVSWKDASALIIGCIIGFEKQL